MFSVEYAASEFPAPEGVRAESGRTGPDSKGGAREGSHKGIFSVGVGGDESAAARRGVPQRAALRPTASAFGPADVDAGRIFLTFSLNNSHF